MKRTIIALVGLWIGMLGQADARTTTNRWQGGTAKWETTKQWSLNKLPNDGQDIVIANPGTFTVTIDDQTASNFPGAMTVSSLSMSNTAGLSQLLLTNRPTSTIPITLTISNSAVIGVGSVLNLVDASSIGAGVNVQASNLTADTTILLPSNVTLSVSNSLLLGSTSSRTGVISVVGGTLIASPNIGNGSLLLSNGVFQASSVNVGVVSGAHGIWQIAGGSNAVTGGVSIGVAAGATGDVVMTSGELSPSGSISVGVQGVGRLVTSNGFLQTPAVSVAVLNGGRGDWQIAGGSNMVGGFLRIGPTAGATGEVVEMGGLLQISSDTLLGDSGGTGALTVSNGILQTVGLGIGEYLGSVGTATIAGGSATATEISLAGQGKGFLWLTGGSLVVTGGAFQGTISIPGSESGGTVFGNTFEADLICSGGVLQASTVTVGPSVHGSPGNSLWSIAGGTSIVQSTVFVTGDASHSSLLSISGGQLQTRVLDIGTLNGGGAVTVSGGKLQVAAEVDVGVRSGSPSVLNVASGEVNVTGLGLFLGISGGSGTVLVAGGTITTPSLIVGESPGSLGVLVISGGVVNATANSPNAMDLGRFPGSTGMVLYAGGTLTASITVGDQGYGSFTVSSNAELPQLIGAISVIVGNQSGAVGEMSIHGGTLFGSPARQVGYLRIGVSADSTGTVWVTDGALQTFGNCSYPSVGEQGSGRLSVTNSALLVYSLSVGSAGTFECIDSSFNATGGGCPVVNSNVMLFASSTGTFSAPLQNTGNILVNGSTVTFFGMVNNSGSIVLTNGIAQFLGGISNTGSVLLGPNQFCVTSVVATGSDVAMAWPVFGGNHYRVQAAGSATDNFFDITADIVPPSDSGLGVTNYLDAGSVTNFPGRFYRIRQIY